MPRVDKNEWTVGELVKDSADHNEQGRSSEAFLSACEALRATVRKISGNGDPRLPELKVVVDENWELIRFLSFPKVDSLYVDLPIVIRDISLNPRRKYTPKEIVIHLVSQTLRLGRMPDGFGFTRNAGFEKNGGTLLVPVNLISGILAFSVVHPVNGSESVPDKYWISISDFKMFISELWGRIDLAERIRKIDIER
ncbi:MAG: hypothetical protein DWQ47_01690 [Acidobacteria bacterium]|nr:MAG: hypothetical protein DWQ32_12150 [Acidobacteriota bacterium]REK04208.1 MAG: hypothetical protein DWQ38_01675 [Acidobacteriota bacterium]REK15370.1 MAG: hypothetical protein DWQ43_17840 [Acidobacteriota bacterium]REK46460.1 MAG: hypothetical protein DWQ47_01690 [Acidobacteriota bacterium]